MNRIMRFNLNDIVPEQEAVLQNQGVSKGATVSDRIHVLLEKAMKMFISSAQPKGIISELSSRKFETIFRGEGENAKDTPVGHIFPRAENLALFALTMGRKVSLRIDTLFKDNDFALGSILDAVASLAADKAVEVCEAYFHRRCQERSNEAISPSKPEKHLTKSGDCFASPAITAKTDNCVLSYSPGYCGWHISGQKKLFQYLQPERIGISLNDSFLMSPLKSVTGVLAAGKKRIHFFESSYPFCRFCQTYSCRQRMKRLSIA